MNIPDGLPTLSTGPHAKSSGEACVMELVSVLAGEQWTDFPACVNTGLADAAQRVNDFGSDDARRQLLEMVEMFIGTASSDPVRDYELRMEMRKMWRTFDGDAVNTCYTEDRSSKEGRRLYSDLLAVDGIVTLKRMIARCDEFNGYDRSAQEKMPVIETLSAIAERVV